MNRKSFLLFCNEQNESKKKFITFIYIRSVKRTKDSKIWKAGILNFNQCMQISKSQCALQCYCKLILCNTWKVLCNTHTQHIVCTDCYSAMHFAICIQ